MGGSFLEQLLSGGAVAAFAALTSVAYKHPPSFRRLFPFLFWPAMIGYWGYIAFQSGIWYAAYLARRGDGQVAVMLDDAANLSSLVLVVFASWSFGLLLLLQFPRLFREKYEDEQRKRGQGGSADV